MTSAPPPGRSRRAARTRRGRRRLHLTTILTVGLLLWAATVLVPWASSLTATLAVSAPAIAVPALGVVARCLPRRRWACAAAAVVAAALPWALVVGYASPGDEAVRGEVPLRVMSFNAHLGEADAGQVVEAARDEDVDVLVVVEASDWLTHRLALQGLAQSLDTVFVSDNPETRTNRLVVYSRLPVNGFRDVETRTGPIVEGTVTTDAGPVHLVAAHLTSPVREARFPFLLDADAWQRDLDTLRDTTRAAVAAGGPVVVVGDLNATPWHRQFRALEHDGGVEDAADLLGHGLRPTWPTLWNTGGVVPLDHVLVSRGVGVHAVSTVVVTRSDHTALVGDLRLPSP